MHEAETIARARAAELSNAYSEQKRIAEMLQRSLLINVPEDEFAGIKLATLYEPAWEEASVGGDFYDSFTVPGGKIALVVGDATGKGLAAATRTAEVKFALRAYMHEHLDPARAMMALNYFLCDTYSAFPDSDSVVALSIGLVDIASGQVVFSAAGAEPPLVIGANKTPRFAESRGLPVGAFRDVEYINSAMPFGAGDTILMATDGVTEARRGKEFLSYEGMVKLAERHLGTSLSLRDEGRAMLDAARTFAGKFQDDVCILLARHI